MNALLLSFLLLTSCAGNLSQPELPPELPTEPTEPADPTDPKNPDAGRIEIEANLGLLGENSRYFEYKGLPLVLFGHQGGLSPTPVATFPPETVSEAARYGNSMFMAMHPAWVDASPGELLAGLQDDEHWERVAEIARTAYEHDVILHVYFWSYKWNYAEGEFSRSDMVWPDPNDDGGEFSGGWTRSEVHELAIDRVVEATWRYPNVVYNFMWEYNTRRASDPGGDFHRWWVERLKGAGEAVDPDVEHLIAISEGRALPGDETADFESVQNPDFVVEEDGNGFWYACETGRERLLEYGVPLVFISSDYPFADNDFTGWDDVPFCPREREHASVSDYRITPADVRNMLLGGFHPAEAWAPARSETLGYYLQARWYMENVGVLDDSLDGVLVDLPTYRPSDRPELSEAEGFGNGRNGTEYAAMYGHPEGLAPAQAEVWIDMNGDGRFSPDPAAGERVEMTGHGDDFREGVLFTAQGPADAAYVFRFADANWNPPRSGGLVPGAAQGISYGHWGE